MTGLAWLVVIAVWTLPFCCVGLKLYLERRRRRRSCSRDDV